MSKRPKEEPTCRQSVSFPKEQHDALAAIAERNNVSICWVVRYACEQLIREYDPVRSLHDLPEHPVEVGGVPSEQH